MRWRTSIRVWPAIAMALAILAGTLVVIPASFLPAAAGAGVSNASGERPAGAVVAEESAAPGELDGFPVTELDDLGHRVTLAERPRRIVSLAPSNTEMLFAVGAGNQVVGVTLFDDFPAEVRSLEKVGGFAAKSISVEKVVGLQPDLVLTAGSLQQPVIDALRRLGIPVFSVDSRSLDHLYDNIRKVGRLTGHAHRAEQVVRSMQARVEAVRSRVAAVEPSRRARVFYEVWDNPLMTAGPQTFIGQLIELAGGINIFSDVQREWPQVSLEELIRRNPDVILGPSSHGRSLALENLRVRTGWQAVRAVQTGRVYLIEDSIVSRPGPRLVQGLEAVARALYPELFPEPPPDPNAVPQQALPARR